MKKDYIIIYFTKLPEIGYSKTRLNEYLPATTVYDISKKLIESSYSVIKAFNHCVYYSYKYKNSLDFLDKFDCECTEQKGKNIGERMYNAICECLTQYEKVILTGSDFLDRDTEFYTDALAELDESTVVLSPSHDGGYGLVGLTKKVDIFTNVDYSSKDVLKQITSILTKEKISYKITNLSNDIDTLEDLLKFETKASDIHLLGAGEYNINFIKDDEKVVRINLSSQLGLGDSQLKYEYLSLKNLATSNVVPKVYEFVDKPKILPKPYLIMEFLHGKELDYSKDLETAAYLLAKVHSTEITSNHFIKGNEPFMLMYTEFLQMFNVYKQSKYTDIKILKRIEDFLDIAKSLGLKDKVTKPCIINTELNNRNFIISEDSSYVIDWEKPIVGDCEQDLAHFLAPTTTNWKTDTLFTLHQMDEFLDIYFKYRYCDKKLFYKYLVFNICRGITWCSMAKVAYEDRRIPSGNETLNKINLFLSKGYLDMLNTNYLLKCKELYESKKK